MRDNNLLDPWTVILSALKEWLLGPVGLITHLYFSETCLPSPQRPVSKRERHFTPPVRTEVIHILEKRNFHQAWLLLMQPDQGEPLEPSTEPEPSHSGQVHPSCSWIDLVSEFRASQHLVSLMSPVIEAVRHYMG